MSVPCTSSIGWSRFASSGPRGERVGPLLPARHAQGSRVHGRVLDGPTHGLGRHVVARRAPQTRVGTRRVVRLAGDAVPRGLQPRLHRGRDAPRPSDDDRVAHAERRPARRRSRQARCRDRRRGSAPRGGPRSARPTTRPRRPTSFTTNTVRENGPSAGVRTRAATAAAVPAASAPETRCTVTGPVTPAERAAATAAATGAGPTADSGPTIVIVHDGSPEASRAICAPTVAGRLRCGVSSSGASRRPASEEAASASAGARPVASTIVRCGSEIGPTGRGHGRGHFVAVEPLDARAGLRQGAGGRDTAPRPRRSA